MFENMEWYRSFYFTALTGSFTKAAEQLFVTQPAVTYSIKQLEAKLGGQLFLRTPKGIKLTAEGEVLFKYIEQAYHFISNGEQKIAEMHQLLAGEIKIGAGDTLCKHFLLPHLETYHRSYPDIKIRVTNRTSPETIGLLKEGKIDFGIINLPVTNESGKDKLMLHNDKALVSRDKQLTHSDKALFIQESLQITDCFVAGAKYQFLAESTVTLQQLLNYPIILLEKGSFTRAFIDGFTAQYGITFNPEFELGSHDLLVKFARSGFGLACVIKNFILEELSNGHLYELKLNKSFPTRRVGIVTLKDVPLSAAAKRMIELLQ